MGQYGATENDTLLYLWLTVSIILIDLPYLDLFGVVGSPTTHGRAMLHEGTLSFSHCGTYCDIPNTQLNYAT
jgi:hypothetical protein